MNPQPAYLDTDLALTQVGDAQTLQGMLVLLEESLTRDIPLIAQHLEEGDVPGANRLLHPLKGFIPIFCTPSLCDHVGAVEGVSKHGSAGEVNAAYAALRPQLEQLLREVSAQLCRTDGAG